MASGGGKKQGGKKQGSSALGSTVAFAGGAIIGATLLYGAKKVYDYLSEESSQRTSTPARPVPVGAEEPKEGYEAERPPEETATLLKPVNATTKRNTVVKGDLEDVKYDKNLHESLLDYYTSYVDIPESVMQEAREVVSDIKELFWQYMSELMSKQPILGLFEVGSTVEGLAVGAPSEFDILMPLNLDPDMWELVDGASTLLNAAGYWMVHRKNLEFFSRGSTPYDKFLVGEYLSPVQLKQAMQDMCHRVGKWGNGYKVEVPVVGNDVKLLIEYGNNQKVTVDFSPALMLGDVRVVAKAHPCCSEVGSGGHQNLWRQTFAEAEMKKLQGDGCQMLCLKILKAIRLNHMAQFGVLNSYMLKQIVLQLVEEEEDWSETALSERFIDMLKTLEDSVRARSLPQCCLPQVNLLEHVPAERLERLKEFLVRTIGEGHFQRILKVPSSMEL